MSKASITEGKKVLLWLPVSIIIMTVMALVWNIEWFGMGGSEYAGAYAYLHFALFGILVLLIFVSAYIFAVLRKRLLKDALTGGMSEAAFREKGETLIKKSPPNTYSVVILTIRNYQLFNDCRSVQTDNILRRFYNIIEDSVKVSGFAARTEENNFYLCLKENNKKHIEDIIYDILKAADKEMHLFNYWQNPSYPFRPGVYIADDPNMSMNAMQARAKLACLNGVESENGICRFYDNMLMDKIEKEHELKSDFESALKNRDFCLYLQPKVWTKSKKVSGAEALVRWKHPQRGIMAPSEFIPIFEANGYICKLDFYIFEEVCRFIRNRQDKGQKIFPISVNFSKQNFNNDDFLDRISALAKKYRIPDKMIEFEVTESVMIDNKNYRKLKQCNQELHKRGFLCSLDDFGSGFSSYWMLMNLNMDFLKLDRSFFRDASNPKAKEIISSMTELAGKIGAVSVAEGIETSEQLKLANEAKCDIIQGYIYAKPMPAAEFEEWIDDYDPSIINLPVV